MEDLKKFPLHKLNLEKYATKEQIKAIEWILQSNCYGSSWKEPMFKILKKDPRTFVDLCFTELCIPIGPYAEYKDLIKRYVPVELVCDTPNEDFKNSIEKALTHPHLVDIQNQRKRKFTPDE